MRGRLGRMRRRHILLSADRHAGCLRGNALAGNCGFARAGTSCKSSGTVSLSKRGWRGDYPAHAHGIHTPADGAANRVARAPGAGPASRLCPPDLAPCTAIAAAMHYEPIPGGLDVEGQAPLAIAIVLEMGLAGFDDATSDAFRNIWILLQIPSFVHGMGNGIRPSKYPSSTKCCLADITCLHAPPWQCHRKFWRYQSSFTSMPASIVLSSVIKSSYETLTRNSPLTVEISTDRLIISNGGMYFTTPPASAASAAAATPTSLPIAAPAAGWNRRLPIFPHPRRLPVPITAYCRLSSRIVVGATGSNSAARCFMAPTQMEYADMLEADPTAVAGDSELADRVRRFPSPVS